ncbi:MAG: pgk, phosphoglycerate kinase, phosphoglycerate kinase [Candidatus Nomurabacteria bacterium]|jgi:phosphoglycerate kinase|nr:pgk, phosphoglycerate kinase, phosphoglycerate kinase [Candidatus Nomurabacteria bacterium]
MKKISSLPLLKGARVLVRVDYNVPIANGRIRDPFRIISSFDTLNAILKKGGTPVLIAHLGDGSATLRPIATFLSKTYNIVFVTHDITDSHIHTIIDSVPKGTIILLENIRRYPQEEKNDVTFAKTLAKLGQYYVNDAFSVCHRKHASVVGVPKYLPSFAGVQMQKEITALSGVVKNKNHPFVFILGGSKFGTKIPLLKRFTATADSVIITGAIMNTFYKESGFPIGKSVTEEGFSKAIAPLLRNANLLLPPDCIVVRKEKSMTITPLEVEAQDVIVDIGPQSIALIAEKIKKAKLVVWNGPTGWYEKGFTKGTVALAKACVASKAQTVIGGGDTGAVVEKILKKSDAKNVFVSTGGGATLDYLAQGTLPGITALK